MPPATLSPTALPARQRRKEARPQELLEAALALFVEKGFAATRSEEVALRAGVSKGTLYLYYPSKEELLKAVVRQNLSQLIAHGQVTAQSFDGPTPDLLAQLMRTWWERVGSAPAGGIYKVMVAESCNFPEVARFFHQEVVLPGRQLIASLLQRGMARGEFRELPLAETTQALVAPLVFMALQKHSFDACRAGAPVGPDPLRVLDTHIDLMLRGLAAVPPPSPPRRKPNR